VKKSSLLSNVSSSAPDLVATDESSSQSRRRWDDIRRHFLPTQPPAQAAQVQPSNTSPTSFDVPQRPSTPKQFRIPKLGLRQVVEQAQELVVDENKRFADEIQAALLPRASRAVEPKSQRRDREGTLATMATSFNMGLMGSTGSLGMASTSSSNYAAQGRSRAMRSPPSVMSVAFPSSLAAPTSLYSVISYHASIASNQPHLASCLPHESEVLSALLAPFMVPRSEVVDGEHLRTMEAFEIIVRTWKPNSVEVIPFIYVFLASSLTLYMAYSPSLVVVFGAAKLCG
jgi:hypothetical protein